jgi:hypothetical protein
MRGEINQKELNLMEIIKLISELEFELGSKIQQIKNNDQIIKFLKSELNSMYNNIVNLN